MESKFPPFYNKTLNGAAELGSVSENTRLRKVVVYSLYGFTLLALVLWHSLGWAYLAPDTFPSETSQSGEPSHVFDWAKLAPSAELKWVSCEQGGLECARFEVPMDHNEPRGDKVAIALIRVKAKVPPTSEKYRGPILFNPGGPGGSGVFFISLIGKYFQSLLGEEYDIVGFDPRGIGQTTPQFSVFNDPIERALWINKASLTVNVSTGSLGTEYARSTIIGQLAGEKVKRVAEYASTAMVARDMLSITRAYGREKLQYWGFSYGTALGATFAAMFPNNVGRLVIDGVVNLKDYFSANWLHHLADADKVLQFWYKECVAAGDACALHANSTSEVEKRVHTILDSLLAQPMPAFYDSYYGVLDYGIVKSVLMQGVYQPFQVLGFLTSALASLEEGDSKPMYSMISSALVQPTCDSSPGSLPISDGGISVLCGERFGPSRDIENIKHQLEGAQKVSIFADRWAAVMALPCAGWKIKAKEMFSGPFNATTSFPLLIIGNTADPVTPLLGAKNAANGFPNSRLMTIDTPGHCSLAGVSLEAMQHVRNYFRKGVLPPDGTVCDIEDTIFLGKRQSERALNAEDHQLLETIRHISRKAKIGGFVF